MCGKSETPKKDNGPNSETYASDYTLEEQASDRWQVSPPIAHIDRVGRAYKRRTGCNTVRYVRSDLFDAKAAELAEALQLLRTPPVTDLAKLEAARPLPNEVWMVVEATARGGRPVAFQYGEEDARLFAELYSADYPGARFDVRKLALGTITLDLSGGDEEDEGVQRIGDTHRKWKGGREHG